MRAWLLAAALAGAVPAAAAPARITEAQVRRLAEAQSRAWNAGDLGRYFASFSPTARFTDQALGSDNRVQPYGVSTLAEARTQSRRTLARSKVRETLAPGAVTFAPDRRSARMAAIVVTEIATGRARRRVCAQRVETFALTASGLRATALTDTVVRCRASGIR